MDVLEANVALSSRVKALEDEVDAITQKYNLVLNFVKEFSHFIPQASDKLFAHIYEVDRAEDE